MNFAKTWWGEKWLDALKGVYWTNRIERGRRYANTGRVYDILIKDNLALAKVKGNYKSYYNVSVEFDEFSKKDRNIIIKTIYENPSILSALLNYKVPIELYDKLKSNGVNVFPTSSDSINASCNCPDYADICKHIAGLVHMIALEIDKDPFLIFKMQGLDLFEALDYESPETTIRNIDNLFINTDNEIEGDADFSIIPDLNDEILQMVDDNPAFYKKDFKKILKSTYTSTARYCKKTYENYTRNWRFSYDGCINLDYTPEDFKGSEEELDDWLDDVFIERWGMPNQWEEFNLNINNNYQISKIKSGQTSVLNKNHTEEHLFAFFTELSESPIDKFNADIKFINIIYQFSLELIKKHALIPELFKSTNTYQIRWVPALFDKTISQIIDKLTYKCPDNLIKFKNKKISKKDQIITLISLFFKGFLKYFIKSGATQSLKKQYAENVFRLFFIESQKFKNDPATIESINQWLSKFIINTRDYDLYLLIEEGLNSFTMDIKVNDEMKSINDVIATTDDKTLKTNLLKDVYLINDIFPNFNRVIDFNEDLEFDLDSFSKFFTDTLPLFENMGIKIILPKSLQKVFKPKLKLEIATKNPDSSYIKFSDLTKFDWKIAIGNTTCTIKEFEEIAEKSKGLVKIANEFVMLDEREIKSLIKQIKKLPEKLNKHELMKAMLSGEVRDADVELDENFDKLIENITSYRASKVPENIRAELRPYQEKGYSWLVQNINSGFGSILADDMGLGKTLQVLTTIQHFKDEGLLEKEKILVIAPTSLLTNWQQEIKKFTPDLTSYIYHGQGRRFTKKKYDIYLTSYGVIRKDAEKFKKKKWFLTVIDEAQNIKNPETKQTKAVKSIKSKHKIAMSGTPVENRLSEYWSIFDFTNKGYLNTLKQFKTNYITPIEKERNKHTLDNFRQITQPFILRRLKSDKNIIKDLPDKIVNDVYCNLTKEQIAMYKNTLDAAMEDVEANDGIKRKGLILKMINSLKQICNHPAQFSKAKNQSIEESGKMEVLINTLQNILDNGEKVIIFTQYVQMGEIMQKLIKEKFKTEALFLHGSLTRKKRDSMVDKFQNNPQSKIFIVSLKAGGTGLNLTAAQNVIHYDLWWNPAVENQATDRAYRIGQKENVMVYRFITSGTFEEKINEMITQKEELAKLTVGTGESFITEMSTDEIKNMLKLR